MIVLCTMMLALIVIGLAIFGVIAVLAGVAWLLWPVIIDVAILITIGYFVGKRRKKRKEDKKKPVD